MGIKIDLHVHTSKYSECAEFLDIEKVEGHAASMRIDALVVTDHDYFWKPKEFDSLCMKFQRLKLFRGIEVSSDCDCHFVVIGIPKQGPLVKGVSIETIIGYTQSHNGAVILAHPYQLVLPDSSVGIEKGPPGREGLFNDRLILK